MRIEFRCFSYAIHKLVYLRTRMANNEKKYVETPLMKQYYAIKAKHPDAVLLFRVGDFTRPLVKMPLKQPKLLELP